MGSFSPPNGSDAAAVFAPASMGGSTGSTERARNGSAPVVSSQRPSQPVGTEVRGEAVCQIAMERKWLWSGVG